MEVEKILLSQRQSQRLYLMKMMEVGKITLKEAEKMGRRYRLQGGHRTIVSAKCYDKGFLGYRRRYIQSSMIRISPRSRGKRKGLF
jgi:cephalosporin-C deacetylase-like acetyl esterase